MLASALLLAALGADPAASAAARAALDAALAIPGGRVELVALGDASPRGCEAVKAEAPRPVTGSGRVALRLEGRDARGDGCDAWAWATVRVHAPSLVALRAVAEGEPLAGAVGPAEREGRPGRAPLGALPQGAVADRALAPGAAVLPEHLRVGPRPGEPVAVVLRAGGLEISQQGKALPCRRGRACALLPSGRRVEGVLAAGRLVLEQP
ncbi:MAG: hypothetical protein ACJ79L_08155 [Anaeromyxobacteraceae bacterium]